MKRVQTMLRFPQLRSTLSSVLLATTVAITPALVAPQAQAQAQSQQNALRIAAVVNDDVISVMDLTMRLRLALHTSRLPNTPQNTRRLAPQVLRSLIDERLQEQEAKKLNIKLSDKELKQALAQVEKNNGMRPGDLRRLAKQLHLPYDIMEDQIRINTMWARAVNRKFARQTRVSDEDVNDRLKQMEENLGKPEHLVSEIYLPFEGAKSPEQVHELATQLTQQLRQGAPFSGAARQFSRSPTAVRGGSLGWVPQGQLEPELDRALAQMHKGDVSNPIRTVSGYYILHLNARRTLNAPDPSQTRLRLSQIKLPLIGDKALSATDQAKVLKYISDSVRGCEAFDAYGKTLGTPGTGPLGSLKVSEMPQSLASAVSSLKVGDPSRAVDLGGVSTVLMVCEKSVPSVLPSAQQLRNQIRGERLTRDADRLLRNLRRSAIIDVRI